jgi:hypothetical protein
MAIYIKDMEMPHSCSDCILFRECKAVSRWLTKGMVHRLKEERHSNCPLIEVKEPHGRLIDADELFLEFQTDEQMRLGENLQYVRKTIDNAPTVIEAEGEDNG